MSPQGPAIEGTQSLGSTSSSLLRRVKQRDPEAWRRLVTLYGPMVFLWCRKAGLSRHDAADMVQETFAAVAGHVAKFRREQPGDSFRGWLWTICQNKIRDQARLRKGLPQAEGGTAAQKAMAQVPEPPVDSSPPSQPRGLLERRALELIRAEFEERTWNAFWQSAIERRPAEQIGAELGMTSKAVRQAKYRVLRRLRDELEGLLD